MYLPGRQTKHPVVAILTYRDKTRTFRGNRDNFLDLLRTASEEGVTAYIVAQNDLNFYSPSIKGYTYNEEIKKWVRADFAPPSVIYNRIPYRKFEQLPEVQRLIRECLSHPDISFFNPSFFSKWSLFQWLHNGRATRKFIPETVKLTGVSDLARLLKKRRFVYLKPVKGKAGKGIMKVQKLQPSKGKVIYSLTYYGDGANTESARFAALNQLYEAASSHIADNEYIVQHGIDLVSAGGRPFDLRVLVQKNSRGEWRISGIGARVAGESSITTHVPRGGTIDNPEKLLTGVFGDSEGKRILGVARKTALIVASQIERSSGHTLGEMSMDLGVDTSGRLWFFEANSKPMKFDEPHIRKMSLRRLVKYWKYLVEKRSNPTGMQPVHGWGDLPRNRIIGRDNGW